jgi:hypothetical protein
MDFTSVFFVVAVHVGEQGTSYGGGAFRNHRRLDL